VIKRPEHVLIEGGRPFLKPNLNAVCQQLILPVQVLLLNAVKKFLVFLLENEQRNGPGTDGQATAVSGRRNRDSDPCRRPSRRFFRDARTMRRIAIYEANSLFEQLLVGQRYGLRPI
jgi:hypothetical protein